MADADKTAAHFLLAREPADFNFSILTVRTFRVKRRFCARSKRDTREAE